MKLNQLSAACALAAATFVSAGAQAQISGDTIKIGFITDLSGLYSDIDGPAGVEAIKMAIADAGGAIAGKKIEILSADHQNKPDVAAAKAREWFDTQGVDMLIGGTNSGTNLAMAKVALEKKKPFISVGAGTSALTNEQCSPYTIHWAYDTTTLAKGTGGAVTKAGGKSWYFLQADYAFDWTRPPLVRAASEVRVGYFGLGISRPSTAGAAPARSWLGVAGGVQPRAPPSGFSSVIEPNGPHRTSRRLPTLILRGSPRPV